MAEPGTNEVQAVNEATGALVGTPITVGSYPKGAAYWQPPTSSTASPLVIVTNSGDHSVTVINATTQTVIATVTLPSGSGAMSVAASPTQPFAIVVDHGTGKVSVINLISFTDLGEISLTSTANALADIAFASFGTFAYVTDPVDHKIFTLDEESSSPYFFLQSTYSDGTNDPTGITTDLSSPSSYTMLVTDAQSSSGDLVNFDDGLGTLSSPTTIKSFSSTVPGLVSLSPGGATAWVQMSGTKTVSKVTVSSGSTTTITPNSSFTAIGAIALSADGSTLLSADTGSGTVQETATISGTAANSTAADASAWAIAAAPPVQDAWDAYVTVPGTSSIQVANMGTGSIIQLISDTAGPGAIAASPDGKYVYVANTSTVSVIQTSLVGIYSNPIVATITGIQGSEPNTPSLDSIAVSPSGDSVIVTDSANGAAYVIDTNAADSSTYYRHVVNRIGLLGGTSSTVVKPAGGLTFSADGRYAYATEQGVSSRSYDGVTVLSIASATTTGYSYDATDEALTQGGTTMILPGGIAPDPNGESLYVVGTDTAKNPVWGLYTFPIGTNGQPSNGSTTVTPVWTGIQGLGVVYSPEDQSAFVTNSGSDSASSVSQANNEVAWSSAVNGIGGNLAVTPDGLDVATLTKVDYCDYGGNGITLLNAGTGTNVGGVTLVGTSAPSGIAIAPQSSPQTISTTELAGGASNPAESGVTSGMNDIVTSGTPSDAPGTTAGVDTATGAYSLTLNSMSIPDLGIPLDMTATYDSSRASTNSLLGYGWDYTYGMTASQNTTSCVVTVTLADGATTRIVPTTSSGTCASRTYQAQSWAQVGLTFASSCNGSDSCFVVTLDGTTAYSIDETTGQLVKIQDLHGNAVTITWGSHTACSGATSTEPCQVTGADTGSTHRTLTFSYPSPGTGTCPSWLASCVVVTDPLGRTMTYAKNSSGDLEETELSNGTTTAAQIFYYGSHLMATWWDPQNQASHGGNTAYATRVTYTSGRVSEVQGPQIASVAPLSTTAITPATTFAYEDVDTATGSGTVLIGNPDFNQSNYEPGASQTLDTYAGFQLVSSVQGFGPVTAYYNGSTAPVVAPNPSESATPMRDAYNLMPNESMNALAGSTEPAVGSQGSEYDSGVTITTYDAHGNVLSATDESGNTTTSTYDGLNDQVSTTDALGHVTTSTYNSSGELLTTTSPPTNAGGAAPETSNWYNANGTLCASRDAVQTATYGVLSSCVSSGSNATTYAYDAYGDHTLTTVTDSSSMSSSTQSVYDANGNICATVSPDGYAAGDTLSSCPSGGDPYASVTVSSDLYANPTEVVSSLTVGSTDTYATTYTCTDENGNVTATVGPRGSFSSCAALSPTSSVDATFTTYDPMGDKVQSIAPLATSGTQGPTSTAEFDADQSDVLDLSSQGYTVWVANNSANLAPYETGTLMDDQGNQIASAPQSDLTSTCEADIASTAPGQPPSALCPDTAYSAYDTQGQTTQQASSWNGVSSSTTPAATGTTTNPTGTVGGTTSGAGGGSGVQETAQSIYDANGNSTGALNEHWNGSSWVTDSTSSTAYAPDGAKCWTSTTADSSPSCGSPPAGTATVDYYDLNGNLTAQVGPGGAGVIEPGATCSPLTAVATPYTINTSELCAFTTYNVYNEANELVETIQPSLSASTSGYVTAGATSTYGYDASGNQTTLVNPAGNTVTTTYDAANRKTGVSYSDTSNTISYSYNVDGTRSQMVDSSGTTTYSYDNAGRLSSVTDSNGNTVTYGYNSFGQQDCISYPEFSSSDSCVNNPDNGTNPIDPGEIWYTYDSQGRMSSVTDWNGDAFTYAYDCTGDVAWLLDTPSSQVPSVTPCQGASGSVPTMPTPSSGMTYVETQYQYSSGASGNLLSSMSTSAVTSSGATPLLGFGSASAPLTYDDNNNLTSSTPYINGTAQSTDTYSYDTQQRVISGPETSGSVTAYSYVDSTGIQPFSSSNTVDQMGIDAMPMSGSSAQLGAEYAGNGQLCWVAQVTSSTGTCANPGGSATNYETLSYNASGDLTETAAAGYGTTSSLSWNSDTSEPTCINLSGTSCSGPSSSQPSAQSYTYTADGLRATANAWNSTSGTVDTTAFTWNTGTSALLSNGAFDYLYGLNPSVPIAQVDRGTSTTGELVGDPNSNVRGIVEVSADAANPYVVANSTDYDTYGTPITANGGSLNPGGLTDLGRSGDVDSATSYGFGGGYKDATGLNYLVHRYYDEALGQFLSVDPLNSETGNPYSYAGDDPVNSADPLGQMLQCINCRGSIVLNLKGIAMWAITNGGSGDNGFEPDCTDFVSRALYFGGGDPMIDSQDWVWNKLQESNPKLWFDVYNGWGWRASSWSWGEAQVLFKHLQFVGSRQLVAGQRLSQSMRFPSAVSAGDILFAAFGGGGTSKIDHAAIITSVLGGMPLFSQHTPTQINFPISYWLAKKPKVRVWIVDPATNKGH